MKRDAYAQQVLPLMEPLYYVACSLLPTQADRDDALQSALEKGLLKCGTLRDEEKLKAWITRILINECHTLLRQRKRLIPMDALPVVAAPQVDFGLRDLVGSLPDGLRLPLLMKAEGYRVQEIAQALRLPVGTVKNRLSKARQRLRMDLSDGKEVLS